MAVKNFRIGNDLVVLWAICNRDGSPYNLANKQVRLFVMNERGRKEVTPVLTTLPDGTINNVIRWDFSGTEQRITGLYTLSVEIFSSYDTKNIKKDYCEAFCLVGSSSLEDEDLADNISDGGELILSSSLDVIQLALPRIEIGTNGNWIIDGIDSNVSALGGGPGLVNKIYDYLGFGRTYDPESVIDTFNAHAINGIYESMQDAVKDIRNAESAIGTLESEVELLKQLGGGSGSDGNIGEEALSAIMNAISAKADKTELSKYLLLTAPSQKITGDIEIDGNLIVRGDMASMGVSENTGAGGSSTLEGLMDVALGSLNNGDLLSWNGSAWINIKQSAIVPNLTDYATKGYVSNALVPYATKDNVTSALGGYLPLSGGKISSASFSPLEIIRNSTSGAAAMAFSRQSSILGYLGFEDTTGPKWWNTSYISYSLIHSGNIGNVTPIRNRRTESIDLNTAANGFYEIGYSGQTLTNSPTAVNALFMDFRDASGLAKAQFVAENHSRNLYFRAYQSGTASITSAWRTIIHDNNIGDYALLKEATHQTIKGNLTVEGSLIVKGDMASGGTGGSTTGGSSSLENLTDVLLGSLNNGDILSWNGSRWVNIRQSSIVPDLNGYATQGYVTSALSGYLPKSGGTINSTSLAPLEIDTTGTSVAIRFGMSGTILGAVGYDPYWGAFLSNKSTGKRIAAREDGVLTYGDESGQKTIAFTDSTVAAANRLAISDGTTYASFSGNNITFGYDTAKARYDTYLAGRNITLRIFDGTTNKDGIVINNTANVTIGSSDLAGTSAKLYVDGHIKLGSTGYLYKGDKSVIDFNGEAPLFGYGTAKAGLETNVYGNVVRLYYGGVSNVGLTLNSSGNVLIGTTTDNGDRLQVSGNIYASQKLKTSGILELSSLEPIYFTSIGSGTYDITAIYHKSNGIVIDRARTEDSSSASVLPIIISQRGGGVAAKFFGDNLYVKGNVLIGTETDNGEKLQVNGTVSTRKEGYAYYWGISNQYFLGSNDNRDYYLWTTAAADLRLGTANTERTRITSGGNVLIGTSYDSGEKLYVNGDVKTTLSIRTLGYISSDRTTGIAISGIGTSSDNRWNGHDYSNLILSNSNNAMSFIVDGTSNGRAAMIQVGHNAANYAQYFGHLSLNPLGGNVLIGTTTNSGVKLHVVGDTRTEGNVDIKTPQGGSICIFSITGNSTALKAFAFGDTSYIESGNSAYGSNMNLHIRGISGKTGANLTFSYSTSKFNGNAIVTGDLASGSDIRFKDIIDNTSLDINDIANAPLFVFKWNDREDDKMHLGTSAQYWESLAPELVTGEEFKTLNYASLGVAMGISLAKKTLNHEERIKVLEEENKALKQEINRMQYGN